MPATRTRPPAVYTGPLWYVRSDSNPNRFYTVGIDPVTFLYVCECPDHRKRFRDCKHIKRVQAGLIRPARRKENTGKSPAPAKNSTKVITVDDLYPPA
jgi:hypothetical protein